MELGATWEYKVDGGSWTAGAGTSFNATAGSHTYSVRQTDSAGNVSIASTNVTYVFDTTAPTCTITDNVSATTATGTITYTFTFNEAVSGFDASDIIITNTEIHSPSSEDTRYTAGTFTKVNDKTYTYTITPDGGTGTLHVDVATGGFDDISGNTNTVDTTSVDQRYSVISMGNQGNLINGIQVEGNWYYYWDRSGDGTRANTQGSSNGTMSSYSTDYATMDWLESTFFGSSAGTVITESNRTFTLDGVSVKLPTANGGTAYPNGINNNQPGTSYSDNGATSNGTTSTYNDLLAIWDAYNGTGTETSINGTPTGWNAGTYWSATPSASGHAYVDLYDGYVHDSNDNSTHYVALQVL